MLDSILIRGWATSPSGCGIPLSTIKLMQRIDALEIGTLCELRLTADGSGFIEIQSLRSADCDSNIAEREDLNEAHKIITVLTLLDDDDLEHYIRRKIN